MTLKQKKGIPCVTATEMAAIDRIVMEKYKLPLLSMMENAGRQLANLTHLMLRHLEEKRIICLVGHGHNSGGGLVAARI